MPVTHEGSLRRAAEPGRALEALRAGVGGFVGLDDTGCCASTMGDPRVNGWIPPGSVEDAILQAARSSPELVIVDAQVLRILMGDLARLLILDTFDHACRGIAPDSVAALEGEPPYVWDSDDLCRE